MTWRSTAGRSYVTVTHAPVKIVMAVKGVETVAGAYTRPLFSSI